MVCVEPAVEVAGPVQVGWSFEVVLELQSDERPINLITNSIFARNLRLSL